MHQVGIYPETSPNVWTHIQDYKALWSRRSKYEYFQKLSCLSTESWWVLGLKKPNWAPLEFSPIYFSWSFLCVDLWKTCSGEAMSSLSYIFHLSRSPSGSKISPPQFHIILPSSWSVMWLLSMKFSYQILK